MTLRSLFPVGDETLHRARVAVHVGRPFDGRLLRERAEGDRQVMMDAVGFAIGELLPAPYRGAYDGRRVDMVAARTILDDLRSG